MEQGVIVEGEIILQIKLRVIKHSNTKKLKRGSMEFHHSVFLRSKTIFTMYALKQQSPELYTTPDRFFTSNLGFKNKVTSDSETKSTLSKQQKITGGKGRICDTSLMHKNENIVSKNLYRLAGNFT